MAIPSCAPINPTSPVSYPQTDVGMRLFFYTPQIRGADSYGSTRVGYLIHNGGLLVYLEGGREEIIELPYGRGVCGTIE